MWKPGSYLWAIPAIAAIAAALEFSGKRSVEVAQVAGGLPLVFFAVALYQFGSDVINALSIGAYGTLLSGIFLLCVVPRMAKKKCARNEIGKPETVDHEAGTGR